MRSHNYVLTESTHSVPPAGSDDSGTPTVILYAVFTLKHKSAAFAYPVPRSRGRQVTILYNFQSLNPMTFRTFSPHPPARFLNWTDLIKRAATDSTKNNPA